MRAVLLLLLPLALAGCVYLRPAVDPAPWDGYGDAGPLRVRGAPRSAAGPVIFRSLAREPRLARTLAAHGEPDTLEVQGSRLAAKRLVLTYRRRDGRSARRVVVDPTPGGYVARTSEPVRRARRNVSGTRVVRRQEPPPAPAAPAPPTVAQGLECPIDPTRGDCLALCKNSAVAHEWCH